MEIALIIATELARKKIGFSGVGFNCSEEEDLIARME
jgi:hypothetical protein